MRYKSIGARALTTARVAPNLKVSEPEVVEAA